MTPHTDKSDGTDRVIDGQISDGFRRYELAESGDTVEIQKAKRMHKFGSGYRDHRPPLSITFDLNERDARAVRDLLTWWLDQRQQDTQPEERETQ